MSRIQTLFTALLAFFPFVASAIPLQYTGVAAVLGGGISAGDTISISFDYDSANGNQLTSGPGQLGYVNALSNIVISTTAAIPTTPIGNSVSVANVNSFGFEGYLVTLTMNPTTFLSIVLPFDVPGTSLALPNTLPSQNQIDLSRLGTIPGLSAAGINLQYQDSSGTQLARFDFAALPSASVPEPGPLGLLLAGLIGIGLAPVLRRRSGEVS